jgi:hypothetical protein
MRVNLRSRIEKLEGAIAPKGKTFTAFYKGHDQDGPFDDWKAAERISRGVGPNDTLIVIRFCYDDDPEPERLRTGSALSARRSRCCSVRS